MVKVVPLEFGAWSAVAVCSIGARGTARSRSPSCSRTGARMFVASRTGRQRRPVRSQLVLTSLRQSRSEVNRSKPGNASGALITANDPGGPAAGIATVRRVITSRSARLIIRRPTATGGRAANGSVLGMSATVAAMRVSPAAVSSAWPPPIEKPHTAIRPASTPCSVRACRTAACQSASCSGREIHPRGLPVLSLVVGFGLAGGRRIGPAVRPGDGADECNGMTRSRRR